MPCTVFGYGSLIFRPDLEYTAAHWTHIKGWARRFYQGSVDHRGIPGAPGRVATLVPAAPDACCWGITYEIPGPAMSAMLNRLDLREVGGYERFHVTTFDREGRTFSDTLLYLATAENPAFLGPAPLEEMAAQIQTAHGPSGANRDYVLQLAAALRGQDLLDPHVAALESALLALGDLPGNPCPKR